MRYWLFLATVLFLFAIGFFTAPLSSEIIAGIVLISVVFDRLITFATYRYAKRHRIGITIEKGLAAGMFFHNNPWAKGYKTLTTAVKVAQTNRVILYWMLSLLSGEVARLIPWFKP
jgi:hypothetical protein